jgi:hypothetical protein
VDVVSEEDGVNVIWLPEVLTVAATRVLAAFLSWNVLPVTVDALTDSLKFARTVVPVLIPVAPLVGNTEVTVGGVLSTVAVVKLQLKLLVNAFPARSFTPDAPPVIVTVYVVEFARDAEGSNVIWLPEVLTVALTRLLPASLNWNVELVTEALLIASLKFPITIVPALTPVAPLKGETDVTVGGVRSVPELLLNTTSTQ